MIHPEHQRRAYLQAMGIDVWLPRDAADSGVEPSVGLAPAAADAMDWDELERCVADPPGYSRDIRGRRGEPFVGRAGQMLNEMLRAVGLGRDSVFIANVLKCRPPNNRDPKPEEAAACRDYLERQIALVQPQVILAVGKIAAQNLLQSDEPVGRLRGRQHDLNGIPLVVTYHPAYLLRSPSQKRKVWTDLCLARKLSGRVPT